MNYYANKGMTFESLIEYANRRYRATGDALITKQHTHFVPIRNGTGAVVTCKVEEKATVDYMGRLGSIPVAFEAKHCSDDRIDLKRVEPHQCDFLCEWTARQAAVGFVFISFRFAKYYLIPWEYWNAALLARQNKTTMTISFEPICIAWTITGKASIRCDEIPNEWAVESGGTVALDYLKTVRRLWRITNDTQPTAESGSRVNRGNADHGDTRC